MEGGEKDQLTTLRSKMVEPMTNYNSRFPDVRVRKGRGMEGREGRREWRSPDIRVRYLNGGTGSGGEGEGREERGRDGGSGDPQILG